MPIGRVTIVSSLHQYDLKKVGLVDLRLCWVGLGYCICYMQHVKPPILGRGIKRRIAHSNSRKWLICAHGDNQVGSNGSQKLHDCVFGWGAFLGGLPKEFLHVLEHGPCFHMFESMLSPCCIHYRVRGTQTTAWIAYGG